MPFKTGVDALRKRRNLAIGRCRVFAPLDCKATWQGTVYDFAWGFMNPLDVTVGPDGALYVADFGTGRIYKISVL